MLTSRQYQALVARAHRHILKGGGITATDDAASITDDVVQLARSIFDLDKHDAAFDRHLATITDHEEHEALFSTVWSMMSTGMETAFTFGAVVGQLLATNRAVAPAAV
jgi:hypothetical protein